MAKPGKKWQRKHHGKGRHKATPRGAKSTAGQRAAASKASKEAAQAYESMGLDWITGQKHGGPLITEGYVPGESFADFVKRQQRDVLTYQQRLATKVAGVRRRETSIERNIREKGVGGLGAIRARLERQVVTSPTVMGAQRMAKKAAIAYGEPTLPSIFANFDEIISGAGVGPALRGRMSDDLIRNLQSRADVWEGTIFPGMKGKMPATLPEEAIRLLTEDPSQYLERDVTRVKAAGAFGMTIGGMRLPVKYGKGPGGLMLGMPRGVLSKVASISGETLPGFMGEGLAKEWQGALYGMRFPSYWAQPRVRIHPGKAAPELLSAFDVLEEELTRTTGRGGTKEIITDVFSRMGALETQPYTGVYRGYLGEMEMVGAKGKRTSLVSIIEEAKSAEHERLVKQFGGRIPRAEMIHGYERSTAEAIVAATWKHEAFTGFGKVSGLLERGMVSTAPLSFLLPFGAAADTARQMYQTSRMGKIVSEIAEKAIPTGMRLAGGRLAQPYVTTPAMELAERAQRSAGGAYSGIYGMVAMEIPQAGLKPLIDTGRMADVVLRKSMHEALAGDISGVTAMQGPEGIAKTGMSAVEYMKGQVGRSIQIEAIRASAIGTAPEALFAGTKGFENVQAIMGFYDVAKKYPDVWRKYYLTSIMEQVGELAPKGPVRTAQKQLLADISSIVGGKGFTPEMEKWLGTERVAGLEAEYAGWEAELWGGTKGEQRNIMREMYKRKPTVAWMSTGRGRRVGRIRFTGREALNRPEVHAIELATERYSGVAGVSPIAPGGFILKDVELAGAVRQMAFLPSKIQPRGQSHTLQAITGLVRPTATGFAPGSKGMRSGGLIVRTLLGMHGVAGAPQMGEFLESMLTSHVSNQGLLGEFTSMLGSMMGEAREARVGGVPTGPGGFKVAAGEITVSGETGRAAFSKWLSKTATGEAIGSVPSHISDWSDLYKQTHLSKLWEKGVRFTLPRPQMISIGGRQVPMAELIIPKLNIYEKMTRHYMETGKWHVPESLKRIGGVLEKAATGVFNAQFYKDIAGMYEQLAMDFAGKTGVLKDVMQPRLAGSATMSYLGAFEQKNLAELLGSGRSLGLAEFAINPKDLERLGGTAEGSIFGLVSRYPIQGQGSIQAVRFFADTKVAEGAVMGTARSSIAMFGDHDFDTVATTLNPFRRGDPSHRTFSELAEKMHYAQREAMRLQLEGPAGALAFSAAQIERAKSFTNMQEFVESTHDKWVGYRKTMMEETGAAFEEAYTRASKETPGMLGQWIARRPNIEPVREAAVLAIRRATNTALSTGLAVNAYQAALHTSEQLFDAQQLSNYSGGEQLISIAREGAAQQIRLSRNMAKIMGGAEQQVLQKGVASELGLMEAMESYARDGGKSRLRDVITDMVKTSATEMETATASGGLSFRLLQITNEASGKIDRAASIAATVEELHSHTMATVNEMKKTGHLWMGGAATRLIGYGQGDLPGTVEAVSDFMKAAGGVPGTDKEFVATLKKMGLPDPTTSGTRMIAEELEDMKDLMQRTSEQTKGTGGMLDKAKHPLATASGLWDWFKAPYKEGTFHYAKRVGAVASVGLVGAAIVSSLLIPRVVAHEPRESSYVDIAPNMRGMGPIRDLGRSVTSGGGMPAVYPYMGDNARAPVHPVQIGPGMGPQRGLPPAPIPDGMAPLPPADYWSLTDAPRGMQTRQADTGQARVHMSADSGMRRSMGKRQRPDMRAQTVSMNRFFGAGLTEIPLDMVGASGYTSDGQGIPPFGGFPLPIGKG